MMNEIKMSAPKVGVETVSGRGFTPEEIATRCTNKIVGISRNAPPEIREQAEAYKESIERIVATYLREAVQSDRTTVYNKLVEAGHPDLAAAIRSL